MIKLVTDSHLSKIKTMKLKLNNKKNCLTSIRIKRSL